MKTRVGLLVLGALGCWSGCTTPKPDLGEFAKSRPHSVLVLPPLNESTEVIAPYSVLTTVTRPLAEAGYYVMPVGLVDQYFKENGITVTGEMHQVPLPKLHEVFGADAVLYLKIKRYGSRYMVLVADSTTVLEARMVDCRTGAVIWKGTAIAQGNSQSGLIEPLLTQILNKMSDDAHNSAAMASLLLFNSYMPTEYFPRGPYHPLFGRDLTGPPRGEGGAIRN